NERSYWPHISKGRRGFVSQLGTLQGLAGICPGRNVQVNPYSVLARARILDEGIPGHVAQGDQRIGADAKLILRDAYTLDATANPDFSQVETNDPQVTLNQRFEVFFPEKRPFFLENAGFFRTPVTLLFSRRIVDPAAGLRLTGKASGWAMGAFAMNDRAPLPSGDPDAGRDAWIGAARRVRGRLLGSRDGPAARSGREGAVRDAAPGQLQGRAQPAPVIRAVRGNRVPPRGHGGGGRQRVGEVAPVDRILHLGHRGEPQPGAWRRALPRARAPSGSESHPPSH